MSACPTIVIDTNVFVAALFRPESHAARVLERVRRGDVRMIWNASTRNETRAIVTKIPPISWASVESLFSPNDEYTGATDTDRFTRIPDPEDRKFAALAFETGALLLSGDDDLLEHQEALDILVLTPREFLEEAWHGGDRSCEAKR